VSVRDYVDDVGAFLSVFAALLLDNVLSFEETANQVTKLVMSTGRPDRELIVALQSFDRLKQEFEALGDALTRYAESTNALPMSGEERARLGRDVVDSITVADLKRRLSRRLQDGWTRIENTQTEKLAQEVGIDVEF
jgi:hypothetical protein